MHTRQNLTLSHYSLSLPPHELTPTHDYSHAHTHTTDTHAHPHLHTTHARVAGLSDLSKNQRARARHKRLCWWLPGGVVLVWSDRGCGFLVSRVRKKKTKKLHAKVPQSQASIFSPSSTTVIIRTFTFSKFKSRFSSSSSSSSLCPKATQEEVVSESRVYLCESVCL